MLKRNILVFFFFKEPLEVQNNIPKGVTRKTFRVRGGKKEDRIFLFFLFFTFCRRGFSLMFVLCLFFDTEKSNSPKSQIIIERKMGCVSQAQNILQKGEESSLSIIQ